VPIEIHDLTRRSQAAATTQQANKTAINSGPVLEETRPRGNVVAFPEQAKQNVLGSMESSRESEGTVEIPISRHGRDSIQRFSRPFGTRVRRAFSPGVETPGYSRDVPSGQKHCRNLGGILLPRNAGELSEVQRRGVGRPQCRCDQLCQ